MKSSLLIIFFFFFSFFINAQSTSLQWAKQFAGNQSNIGWSIAVDAVGNIYTIGDFTGAVDFDPSLGSFILNSSGTDIFIQKSSSTGNLIWVKQIGSFGNDYGYSIDIDNTGNIYCTGYFVGNVDFDPSQNVYNLSSTPGPGGYADVFILKLDTAANFIWAKSFGGNLADAGESATHDSLGNVYITGSFDGVADFDPGPGVYNLTSQGNGDIFVLKLSSLGNFVWAKSIGGTSTEFGKSIKVDITGNVYTVGHYGSSVDFDPNAGVYNLTPANGYDIFISKLDASGNFVWAKSVSGSGTYDTAESITLDQVGSVYITGEFQGLADFDPDISTYNLTASVNGDAFILKLNSLGHFMWAKSFGTSFVAYGYDISTDAFGNVYTVGGFQGTADFDPGIGTYSLTSSTNADAFLSKLDTSGNFIWASDIVSQGLQYARAIAIDYQNAICVCGQFYNTVDFDPTPNIYNLISSPGYDIFIQKLDQCAQPFIPNNITPVSYQTICSNNSTTLTVASNGTINWFATQTSTSSIGVGSIYVTPILAAGNYTYYASATTCSLTSTRTPVNVNVILCTNVISENVKKSTAMIYPNPTNDILNIEFENNYEAKVEITNSLGQIVFEELVNSKNVKLDLKNLNSGLYFLKLTGGDDRIIATQKIIKD